MSAGLTGGTVPPFVLEMEAAQRRQVATLRLLLLSTCVAILLFVGGFLVLSVGINVDFLQTWAPFILGGLPITLFISVVSILMAVALAVLGALGRLSSNPILNGIASLYVSIVRGTPLIVQILFILSLIHISEPT